MLLKMKRVVFYLSTVFFVVYPLFIPATAYATNTPGPWTLGRCVQEHIVYDNNGKEIDRIQVATIQGFECLFVNIVRVLTPIAGLAVFVMFIVGAFQLITAGGEAKQIQKARKTLTYAVLGLVLFVGIWFILKLIQTITGVDVTTFEIPGP